MFVYSSHSICLIFYRTKNKLKSWIITLCGGQWPTMLYSCIYNSSDPWNGLLRNRILVQVSKHSCFKACEDSHLQRHTNIYSHCQDLLIQSPRQLDWVMLTYMVCYVLLVAWLLISPPRCICYSMSKHICWLMTLRFTSPYLCHWSSLTQTRSATLSISSTAFWNFFTTQKSKRRSRNSYLGGTGERLPKYYCIYVT